MNEPILDVRDLTVEFRTGGGRVRAVESLSFSLARGRVLAIVGESGSGKTTVAHAIARLLPTDSASIPRGEVVLAGQDLLRIPPDEMWRVRGRDVALVFQEPMTSLNPVHRVGRQIAEAIRQHEDVSPAVARARSVELLRRVGIPEPERRVRDYPHQLSGGLRQRVMIAMALACRPALLIADEPTTALDVTVQAQVLRLLLELKSALAMSIILITHDLGIVAQIADDVIVMYAGRAVEQGPVARIFATPLHPYTQGLLASIPRLESFGLREPPRLSAIDGVAVSGSAIPKGCAFAPRCRQATDRCRSEIPAMVARVGGQSAACTLVAQVAP